MFKIIYNWIIENSEWVFSGIGVTLFFGLIAFFRGKTRRGSYDDTRQISIHQKVSGNNNVQIGIQNNNYGGKKSDK